MINMEFTKESIKVLDDTLTSVIRELDKIRLISKCKDLSVKVTLKDIRPAFNNEVPSFDWKCHLTKDSFFLRTIQCGTTYTINFASRNKFGRMKVEYDVEDRNAMVIFLNEYSEIREKFIKEAELQERQHAEQEEKKRQAQEETLKLLKQLQKNCNNEATIEIDLPNTNNQHTFEIKEEKGQKIGTISLNGMTLKIITNGGVKIKNNLDEPKVKRK